MMGRLETVTLQGPPRLGAALEWLSFPLSRTFLGTSTLRTGHLLPKGCLGANRKMFPETLGSFEVDWFRHQTEMRHLYPLPPEVLDS